MTATTLPLAQNSPSAPRRKPYLVVRARRSWLSVNLRELWLFRDLLLSLTARDIKLRYKQTALGVLWVVLQPLLAAGILSFVFGKLANLHVDETATGKRIPYFLFMFTSLVVWNFFANIVNKVSNILVGNSALVAKVYFPRLLLPLSGAMGMLVDLAVSAILLIILQLTANIPFGPQLLFAPLILLLIMSAALGIAMAATALSVQYRDVAYILPVIVQLLFFASPIAYSVANLHGRSAAFYQLNPLTGTLSFWRWSILGTPFPPLWTIAYTAAFSLLLLLTGTMIFQRMERTFADII
ncbi:MAG: ABC transporter permease [Phycisphaerales bacterium]|nr:ABC transporter permease [Phycisphaerales bacterium]